MNLRPNPIEGLRQHFMVLLHTGRSAFCQCAKAPQSVLQLCQLQAHWWEGQNLHAGTSRAVQAHWSRYIQCRGRGRAQGREGGRGRDGQWADEGWKWGGISASTHWIPTPFPGLHEQKYCWYRSEWTHCGYRVWGVERGLYQPQLHCWHCIPLPGLNLPSWIHPDLPQQCC